jgi:uncharacterized membrane protein YfcA
MYFLALVFGIVVGLSLGLTGGGGSLFAVPLLVFGLSVSPSDAVAISLLAVAIVALVGVLRRWRSGLLVPRGAALMAAGGVASAPLGSWLAGVLPGSALMLAFSLLMAFIAILMWRTAGRSGVGKELPTSAEADDGPAGIACRFDPGGRLRLTSRCALGLVAAGVVTGVLSGLFGVGGGFLVVPALIYATGMGIHRAIATSLLVIALIGASGFIAHLAQHPRLDLWMVALFIAGGIAGLEAGGHFMRRLSGRRLQRGFAAAIVCVSVFVITKTLTGV